MKPYPRVPPRKRSGGSVRHCLGLASLFVAPFLLMLYIECSMPSLLKGSRDPRVDTADTYRKEVRKLSPAAISALQTAIKDPAKPPAPPSAPPSPDMGPEGLSPEDAADHLPIDQTPSKGHGEESADNPSSELKVDEMRFRIENHGYQCLVYSSLARKVVPAAENEVTWVTQLTVDRLPSLEKMLERWNGPVSAALYSRELAMDVREIERFRDTVDFHIVGASQGLYPVNTLRNVALNNARSEYVVLADVDFLPSAGMYEFIRGHVAGWKAKHGDKCVYVIPAFVMETGKGVQKVPPKDKQQLLAMGESVVHQVHNDPARSIAHKYTDYGRWLKTNEVYQAEYKFPYEPYFMAPRTIPRYDVRFIGYGNDKASHAYELDKAGFKFNVMPNAFVIHTQHPQGNWVTQTFLDPKDRMSRTLTTFLADVDRRYKVRKFKDEVTDFPPLPESAGYEVVVGRLGESCTAACLEKGKECKPEWSERVNMCRELEKHTNCVQGCNDNFFGADLPAYNSQRDQCLINNAPKAVGFSCPVTYQFSRRLCPCGARPKK